MCRNKTCESANDRKYLAVKNYQKAFKIKPDYPSSKEALKEHMNQ